MPFLSRSKILERFCGLNRKSNIPHCTKSQKNVFTLKNPIHQLRKKIQYQQKFSILSIIFELKLKPLLLLSDKLKKLSQKTNQFPMRCATCENVLSNCGYFGIVVSFSRQFTPSLLYQVSFGRAELFLTSERNCTFNGNFGLFRYGFSGRKCPVEL